MRAAWLQGRAAGRGGRAAGGRGGGRASAMYKTHVRAPVSPTRLRATRVGIGPSEEQLKEWAKRGQIGCYPGTRGAVLPWATSEALVTEPQNSARGTPNHTLDSFQRTAQKRCAMIVDRHVHKNGGSTVRDLFLENERLGYGLYQGYSQMYWVKDFKEIKRVAERAVARKEVPRHLLMFEAHFGFVELNGRVLEDLKGLESLYTQARPLSLAA